MNAKLIIGVILLLVGIFYGAAPHSLHVSSGLAFGLDHTMHIVLGIVLIIIGIVAIWKRK